MDKLPIGAVVYLVVAVDDPVTGDSPGCRCCSPGEKLIVRKNDGEFFDYYVSHEHRTDASFGVKANEIAAHQPAQPESKP